MSKIININSKEYDFEFTIEASLYKDCVESTLGILQVYDDAQATENDANRNNLKNLFNSMADIPKMALTMFYAGLMENHSDEITSVYDAKKLLKDYMKEHKDDTNGSFFGVINLMLEVMEIDGFFQLIGLGENKSEKKPKTPQDHKKKQN